MYLTKADHSGHCFRCGDEYSKNTPIGVIRVNSGKPLTHYAHPKCWLELGLAMLGDKDYEDDPKRQITKEQQAMRKSTLHYWAQLAYRERQIKASYTGEKLEKMLRSLEHAKDDLRMRMTMLGGMPRSWKR